jgi:type IV secretion system protein VirB1
MDPAAFAALVERCAPTAMLEPLAAIVRQASSFEPLLITVQARKPIPIQATDRNEAVQLATEAIASGQPVRSGLAQLDAAELKQAGLTITTAFDACEHVAGLSRLFDARSQAVNARVPDRGRATATVIASFAVKAPSETPQTSGDNTDNTLSATRAEAPAPDTSTTNTPTAKERPSWDVYRSGFGTSAFVYER